MKKPVTSYGSIDATLADTCSYYYSSSAETSPESSSEDLITRSSSNNNNQHQHQHQHRPHGKASTSNAVLMVDFMTFSGRTRSKDRCYKYLLSLLLIIIIIILIVWLLLVVASSFLAAFWSHFHWKLPFWSSSQNIGQEQGVEEYDYIIVGAGPAGLVVAFHLAKRLQQESIKAYGTTDHAGKVLVLESGRESQSDVMKVLLHDSTSSHGFVKDARNDENHYSQQQDKSSWTFVGGGLNKFDVPFLWSELSSRDDWSEYLSHHWPVDQTFLGRAVGGSGIHNAMINVRALPNDFQKWNVTNWSADEMMPYFDKLEDYRGTIPIVANYSPPLPKPFSRGSNGPLKTVVGGGMAISPLCAYFISSAVAAGFPLATLGFNDAEALNRIGVGFYEFNIRNGIRDSVAKALLSSPPQQQGGTSTIPSNLIIRTDATVHRVIFETLTTVPRAVGVEYYSNDQQTVGGSIRRQVRLRSSRSVSNLHPLPIQHDPEVILSAGAILSSQILANSGISKGGFLVDSPNVGNNLQDHPVVAISYRVMGDLSNSISSFFQMDGSNSQLSFETYLKSFPNNNHSTRYDDTNFLSNSVYGTAGFSVGGFLSSPWSKDGDHVPDIQITVFPHTREPHFMHNNHNLTLTAQQSSHNNTNSIANVTGTNILITVALLQPESRNSLVMAAAAAAANDTTNSPEQSWSSLGNFPLPQIQGGSLTNGDASRLAWGIKQVRNIMSTSPLKDVIQYEQRPGDQCTQDQDLIQYVKDNVMRNAHWSGSTRMGNDDDDESDSVVDSRLRVRGVESLRIVDAGVMPLIPNGNTHSTTCVIALRAVDLILDQGLKK